jgi:hypothetical protein
MTWVKLQGVSASTAHRLLADLPSMTAFAQDVEESLDGQELRYDERQRLLKRAEHFGIRRFDANLIIAMVQERGEKQAASSEVPRKNPVAVSIAATFLIVQSAIIAGAWWVFFN